MNFWTYCNEVAMELPSEIIMDNILMVYRFCHEDKPVADCIKELRRPKEKLRNWSELIATVELPMDMAVALSCGRIELIAKPRALKVEEAGQLLQLLRVLMQTNQELQKHSAKVADMAENIMEHFKGLQSGLIKISDFASFCDPEEKGDD
jgi:hypothetical protein